MPSMGAAHEQPTTMRLLLCCAVVARLREDLEIARGKLAALDPNATLQDLKSFKDAKALLRKTIPTRPPVPATAQPPAQ